VIASAALGHSQGRAQSAPPYPSQDVHFICGFAPGSGPDIITRFMADKMRPHLKRTIVVENKVGAVGNIATEYVAKAKPDGYTVYITGGNSLAASMFLFKNPPVDVGKDLDIVATLSKQPTLLVVGPNSPHKTLAELTAAIKLKGEKASYGTAFPTARILGALYRNSAKTQAVEVQYRTSADWINDLTNGSLDFAFIDSVSGVNRAKQGSFRVLAVTTGERPQALPDYPTMKESGYPIDVPSWWGAFVPAGTPKAVIDQLNAAFSEVINSEEGRKFNRELGGDSWITTADFAHNFYLKEIKDWGEYVRIAKIEPQG
jgi:tripartite-type tricarboxylate transporter receptor subunit TctC